MSIGPLHKSVAKPVSAQRSPQRQVNSQSSSAMPNRADAAGQLLAMQQSLGNKAVQRLLASHTLQAKLTVGAANDQYEQEADRVAAQVMNPHTSTTPNTQGAVPGTDTQRSSTPSSTGGGSFQASSGVESSVMNEKGSGSPLPADTLSFMETRFGADFGKVRVHTGGEAPQLNRALQAEAFTHGNDIYFGHGKYDPQSSSGKQLLAHELTHVVQQTGAGQIHRKAEAGVEVHNHLPANRISTKKQKMYLDFVRMKRQDPQFSKIIGSIIGSKKLKQKGGEEHSGGTYGHWWTEIGDLEGAYPGTWSAAESYGWWPKESVTTKTTFAGVEGQLNKGSRDDPHHGEAVSGSQQFHPVMELDPTANYEATRTKVVNDIRKFSKGYKGKWAWRLGWGQNCHTFQQALKKAVGIHNQKGVGWFKKPDETESMASKVNKERQTEVDEAFNAKHPGVDYRLNKDVETSTEPIVTLPAGTIVRVTEDNGPIDAIPDWQMVMVIHNQKFYQIYFDKLTGNSVRV